MGSFRCLMKFVLLNVLVFCVVFLFACRRPVSCMLVLSVFLDCPFLIAPSFFSSLVFALWHIQGDDISSDEHCKLIITEFVFECEVIYDLQSAYLYYIIKVINLN